MGNLQDIDRDAPAVAESASPGQRLRMAREARHVTRDAVAAHLRIEPGTIDALEIDDYARLPAAVFVRGYLRAYAKLVGLEVDPLLSAFDQRTARTPPPLVLPAAVGPDIETRAGFARWIVLALALLSLLLFYQWWHLTGARHSPVTAVSQVAGMQSAAPKPAPAIPKADIPAEIPAAVSMPPPDTPLENLYETPADESGLGEVTAAPPAPVTAKTAPAPAVTSPVVAVPPTTVAATGGSAVQTKQPAAESKPVAPDAATGPLVMRFNDDCWVVVRDTGGRALLQGLIKSGQRHVLYGKPPFQLTLGNAPAVEIEYLGQRFDQSSYTGPSRIARFTLGK